jgi:iduronate 2-sulfatase
MGQHGQWMKETLFEHAARVPFLLAGPGISAHGQVCRHTTEHLDIYPTLAELCALNGAPKNLHGESLVRLLGDPSASWTKPAITQVSRGPGEQVRVMGYSIRTERYRYTVWQDGYAGEELYDYESDPRELNNLASEPAMRETKFVLRIQLDTILASRGKSS